MNEKISIIVPVYNVERYLERCVNSLVNQTYSNIEIILVDDKSPDSSGDICDNLAKTDARIKVVHKEQNEGLGFARNTGIDNATGDYIIFVDSDDYIDLKTCEIAKNALEKHNADICCYRWADVFKNNIVCNTCFNKEALFEGEEIAREFLAKSIAPGPDDYEEIGFSAWQAIYKAELFENGSLRFVCEREFVNEDMIFRVELCKKIKIAAVIKDNLYYYFRNSGTLSSGYRKNRFEDSCKVYNKINEMLGDFNCAELYQRNVRFFMINTIVSIKQEVEKYGFSSIKLIREICKNEDLRFALKQYSISKMKLQQRLLFKAILAKRAVFIYLLVRIKFLTQKNKIS